MDDPGGDDMICRNLLEVGEDGEAEGAWGAEGAGGAEGAEGEEEEVLEECGWMRKKSRKMKEIKKT